MIGGAGDDLYMVDRRSTRWWSWPAKGPDTVQSSIGLTLAANVENLTLTGMRPNGVGNGLDNVSLATARPTSWWVSTETTTSAAGGKRHAERRRRQRRARWRRRCGRADRWQRRRQVRLRVGQRRRTPSRIFPSPRAMDPANRQLNGSGDHRCCYCVSSHDKRRRRLCYRSRGRERHHLHGSDKRDA